MVKGVSIKFKSYFETVPKLLEVTKLDTILKRYNSIVIKPNLKNKTTVSTPPSPLVMTAGQGGAVFPIVITNVAGDAKTAVISVSGYESFGSVRLDPSSVVVVEEGQTQTVYMFVSANEDASGSYTFPVTVTVEGESKQILVTATVAGADVADDGTSWDSVKEGIKVAVIVLVILLVILGLIIVVNKLRSQDDEDEEEKSKTYY